MNIGFDSFCAAVIPEGYPTIVASSVLTLQFLSEEAHFLRNVSHLGSSGIIRQLPLRQQYWIIFILGDFS